MKKLLTAVLLFPLLINAQKSCDPHRNSIEVCDSVANLCRVDAHFLTMLSVSKPTSNWYDSLYLPQELLLNYDEILRAMYNDLEDTLADFRWYIREVYDQAVHFHPDSMFNVMISVPVHPQTGADYLTMTKIIDSTFKSLGGKYSAGESNWAVEYRNYTLPSNINLHLLERRLQKINPGISFTNIPRFRKWQYRIDIDEGPDQYNIRLLERSKCMAPELPCHYIIRTFYYLHEYKFEYGKFERGTVPWPED